jgi:hypothetical protein
MSNKLHENYIRELDSPDYKKPNWIESFIYVYKEPQKVPLNKWLDKLDEDVDYFEKQWKPQFLSAYDNIRDEIIETNCAGIDSETLNRWRLIVNTIIDKHPGSWLTIYASEIIYKTNAEIQIGIVNINDKKLEHIKTYLEELKKEISIYIGQYFTINFRGIYRREQIFHNPYSWEDCKNQPEVHFDILTIGDKNLVDEMIGHYSSWIVGFKEDVERFQDFIKRSEDTLAKLESIDTRKWTRLTGEVINSIVSNNLSDIDYRSLVGSGFENCEYERKLLFSRKDNCATRATKWDIFCEEHLADSYTSVTDLIRENKRKEYSTRFPDLDKLYLDIKFSKPTEQILELRKNINKVSEELLLKQWEASIKNDEEYLFRFNLQIEFLNRLKPIYEKYRYIKFGRPPIPMTTKLQILKKSNFKCVLCNADLMEKEPHIDHIIPLYKGGGSETSNLQALCWECNLKKGTKIL